jgi:hypothetical protein
MRAKTAKEKKWAEDRVREWVESGRLLYESLHVTIELVSYRKREGEYGQDTDPYPRQRRHGPRDLPKDVCAFQDNAVGL